MTKSRNAMCVGLIRARHPIEFARASLCRSLVHAFSSRWLCSGSRRHAARVRTCRHDRASSSPSYWRRKTRYVLNAQFDLALNPTLEEALQKGISLYFVLEFELGARAGTGSMRKSRNCRSQYRMTYSPLTRQYRVASGLLGQQLDHSKKSSACSRASFRGRGCSGCADAGRTLRRGGAPAPRRRTVSQALSDQCACIARLVASVGVVSMELHTMSVVLAPRALRYVLSGVRRDWARYFFSSSRPPARIRSSSPAITTSCSCSTGRWSCC